jgi:hypothetical protein
MWAIKNKPISFRQSEILRKKHEQKEQTEAIKSLSVMITLWNLPKDVRYGRVMRCLSFYEKARILK